jgi:hypothetical protein
MNANKLRADSVFFVLDFDRMLGNTGKFHDFLEMVIEQETEIKASQLRTARFDAEARGKSFDTVDYLRQFLNASGSEKTWQQIQRVFIARIQNEDMLEPYAAELLQLLKAKKLPHGIVTFGGEAWQLAKLEGANLLEVPHVVTHIQEKGKILTGWKKASGDFIIPPALTRDFKPLTVTSIVFLDDKSVSFRGIPEGVYGIRVRPPEGLELATQKAALPGGIADVNGIQSAIELLSSDEYNNILDKA